MGWPSLLDEGRPFKFPRESLWRFVIAQAVFDAEMELPPLRDTVGGRFRRKRGQKLQREARAWLTEGSQDFIEVCCLADLDPDAVLDRAMQLKRANWQ